MPDDARPDPLVFRERMAVPPWWWFIALFFVVSMFVAVGFYLGPWVGAAVTVGAAGIVVAVLLGHGGLTVTVDDRALSVGPARIGWQWVAGAAALDAAATRHRLGPGADARAHLAVRSYLPEAVEVTLADTADPHPYWLVGSRRAVELAAAINERAAATHASGEAGRDRA